MTSMKDRILQVRNDYLQKWIKRKAIIEKNNSGILTPSKIADKMRMEEKYFIKSDEDITEEIRFLDKMKAEEDALIAEGKKDAEIVVPILQQLQKENMGQYCSSVNHEGNFEGSVDCLEFARTAHDKLDRLRKSNPDIPESMIHRIETGDTRNYHSFLEISGRYYDFDNPEGKDSWEDLDFIKCYGLPDDWELY